MSDNSNKLYENVAEMLRDISEDEEFNREVKDRIAQRQVVKALQAMRAAGNVSQAAIAKELNCSQSRVSKIENGIDGNLRLRELEAYAKALNSDVFLTFTPRDLTSLDRIKLYALCMHRELCRLAEFANKDEEIARGVAETFGEVLYNQMKLLQIAADRLPADPDTSQPYIKIDMRMEEGSGGVKDAHRRRSVVAGDKHVQSQSHDSRSL